MTNFHLLSYPGKFNKDLLFRRFFCKFAIDHDLKRSVDGFLNDGIKLLTVHRFVDLKYVNDIVLFASNVQVSQILLYPLKTEAVQ